MANLSKYVVQLEAQTAQYQRKLEQANKKLTRFEQANKRSLANIKRAFGGLAAAVSIGALTSMARNALNSADQIAKLTDRIGGTTEGLSELGFVAERSGVAFNTLSMGLQRMVRRVAEAAKGTGEAKDALKELRLDAGRLIELPLEEQFERVADALSGVETQGDRTRLAMKLFDSEGVALLQTMTNGAAGIRGLRNEARSLGVTLSRDQANAAVRAKDAMANLDAQFSALKRNLTLGVIPAVEAVAISLNSLLFNASPFPFQKQIDDAQDRLRALRKQMADLQITDLMGTGSPQLDAIGQQIAAQEKLIEELNRKQRSHYGLDGKQLGASAGTIHLLESAASGAADAVSAARRELAAFNEQQRKLNENLREFHEKYDMKKRFDEARESIKGASDELDKFFKDQDEKAQQATEAVRELGLTFSSAFEDAIVEGERLSEVLKGLLQDILRIIVRRAITDPLASAITSKLPIPQLAGGGHLSAGSPAIVGERGPEFFVPDVSGTVVPNGKMGGIVVNNYLDNRGSDPTFIARLPAILEQNRKQTIAEIMQLQATRRVL